MKRDYAQELTQRIDYIQNILKASGAQGIVFGNSGGKDSALVGILCRRACANVLGVAMPCHSKRNYGEDMDDAMDLSRQFGIETIVVDLTDTRRSLTEAIAKGEQGLSNPAIANIAPRLRMTTLYSIAQSRNSLVAGTGNRSEIFMGYFTKWGDGSSDFNPIADLTASEILEFLRFLEAPEHITVKAPSAGLFEGQTDETEMGVTYAELDHYILTGEGPESLVHKLTRVHENTAHKRRMPLLYPERP